MTPLRRYTPGDVIASRYCIVTLLGKGGMSETYEAEDLTTHQWVALKVLSLRQMMDWMLDLFEREAEILAQLDHPNIPNYIDSFHLDLDDSSGQSDTNAVQNNPQGEACVLTEHTQHRYTVHYIGQPLMPSEQE